MKLSRRTFLRLTAGASLVATTGCSDFSIPGFTWKKPDLDGPIIAPIDEAAQYAAHVLNRLSFGMAPGDLARVVDMGTDAYIEEQLTPASIDNEACEGIVRRLETLCLPTGELFEYQEELLLKELTRGTVLRAVYSNRQLEEVMVEFWTDHFNIDSSKGDCQWLKTADDRDVIRKHALGSFRELVRASALSPAMLWYLDGRVNRKARGEDQPNENFARELLELHTLGVHGGYSQQDVMEAARALTGWTVRSEQKFGKGRVEFIAANHDDGEKSVLEQTIPAGLGKGDIDALLDIAVGHPATARHIATKLCTKFISDEPSESSIAAVADSFSASHGDIRQTLRAVFNTDEFQNSAHAKVKRPFRFVVSALRGTGAVSDAGTDVLDYLLRMGHSPFQYPTPDGYPEEPLPWMGTLFWRWHFAVALAENSLGGTRVDWDDLVRRAGDERTLGAHLFARQPSEEEVSSIDASGLVPAMILASPGFQRY